MNTTEYGKLKSKIRGIIDGMILSGVNDNWSKVFTLFNFALSVHNGKRKGGDHEFSHQLNTAAYAFSMFSRSNVLSNDDLAVLVALIVMHDVPEDYYDEFELFVKNELGGRVYNTSNPGSVLGYQVAVTDDFYSEVLNLAVSMSRVDFYSGNKLSNKDYYNKLSINPFTAFAKAIDRIHNLSTMIGVMKPTRIKEYLNESVDFVLPMIKDSSRKYPMFAQHYEQLKSNMNLLIDPIQRLYAVNSLELVPVNKAEISQLAE